MQKLKKKLITVKYLDKIDEIFKVVKKKIKKL